MMSKDPKDHYRALMASPTDDPERNKLRERIKWSGPALTLRAKKYLTLGAVYTERERFAKTRDVLPTYEQWLRTFLSPADAKKEAEKVRREWAERNARAALEPLDD